MTLQVTDEILATAPFPVCVIDAGGTLAYCNQAARDLGNGESWHELAGVNAVEAAALLDRARAGRRATCNTTAMRWDLRPGPQPAIVLAFGTDRSDTERAENDALRQRTLLRTILDAIPDIVFCKDVSGRYFVTNPAYCRFFGLTSEQTLGRRDEDFFAEADTQAFRHDDRLTMALGHPRTIHEWVPSAAGERQLIETIKAPLAGPDGEVTGIVGVARNVTERWYAEELQKRRGALLDALVRASHRFLDGESFATTAPAALADIGAAVAASRVTLFENRVGPDGRRHVCPLFRWPLALDRLAGVIRERTYAELGLGRWEDLLATGEAVVGATSELPPAEQQTLLDLQVKSIVVLPIFMGRQWWGIITIVDSEHERQWYPDEIEGLKLAAATIGSAVMRDRAVQAVVAAKEEAEAAYQAKNLFLANLGHEIRTPMHGILSYARFGLKKTGQVDCERLLEYFTNIYDSGSRLMDLLTDLLDLSKLEAGRTTFDMSSHDLISVLNTVASEVGPRLAERRMQLVVPRPAVSSQTWCDERAVGQILRNLITNAIHYSPEGSPIVVTLRDHTSAEGRAMLEIRVADRGIGVPEDEREAIFGEFVQSSKTISGVGGTGLGLAICRRITRRHGGRIWVEAPAEGAGSVFAFTLPRDDHGQVV